jgi:ketosteroid isomerase-like protein
MMKERSLKEEVRATMAEFAAAFEKGQVERLASMLAPETRLYLTDAKGTEEIIGAAAASSKLGEYKEHRGNRLAFKKALVLQEGRSAYFDAQFEGHQAAKYGAAAPAKLTAELERHGEQWQVKQMHYRTR